MSKTTNYNLVKPVNGSSGWGDDLNSNFDKLDTHLKSSADAILNHTGAGTNKHEAKQIKSTLANNVDSALTFLNNHKANVNHAHDAYALKSELQTLVNTIDLLAPELSNVNINASINNRVESIIISCQTSPIINISYWLVEVRKNGCVVFESVNSSSHITVSEQAMPGVADGDDLEITIIACSGKSSKTKVYNHHFKHVNSHFADEISLLKVQQEKLKNQLNVANIIDSFAQNESAIQALANVLHSSNTLAQKVAELNR